MTDRVDLLARMDRVAVVLRRAGLRPLIRVGREILRKVLRDHLSVEWDGFTVTGGIEHRGYLRSLRAWQREAGALAVWRTFLRPGATVVDVGAYLGAFSLVAARIVGSSGRVFALEPDPRNVPHLRRNVAINGYEGIVRVFAVAASDKSGPARFYLNDGDASGSSLVRAYPRARLVEVPCVSLDELLAEVGRVDAVKIDVEGAEPAVLRGTASLLERSPEAHLICEVNPTALSAGGSSPEELLSALSKSGFACHAIEEPTGELLPLPTDWSRVKYLNVLARPSELTARAKRSAGQGKGAR